MGTQSDPSSGGPKPKRMKPNKSKARNSKSLSPEEWRQKIRDKVCLSLRAKIGVLHGKKLEKYLYTTYGGGGKVWNERIYGHIANFRAIPTLLRGKRTLRRQYVCE